MKTVFAGFAASAAVLLAATAAPAARAAAPPAPDNAAAAAPSITFRPADGAGWGGQTLVAPRPIYLSTRPAAAAKLASVVLPKGASILFGALENTAVAQVRDKNGVVRIFLDANGDRALTANESLTLQKGVVRWPACKDDRSAVAHLRGRTAVVWSCQAPNVLFWAWRGFLQGNVSLDGAPRPAFLVDGNANGTFGEENGDLLWIDRNGDNVLDPVTEQFPCAPVLRIGGQMYRWTFQPAGASGGTAVCRRVERGVGRRTVAFAGELAGRIVGAEGTLLSQADDIVRAQSAGQELEMPAGNWALTSLALQASGDGKPGGAWSYSFSRSLEGKDAKNFPVAVEAGNGADLALYQNMSLAIEAGEAATRPGEELKIQLIAKTDLGLELNNVRRAGQGEYESPENFATISLLDSSGKTIGEAHTGFA